MSSTWSDSSWNSFQVLAGCTASAVHLWDPWTPSSTVVRSQGTSSTGPRRTLCWSTNGKVMAYGGRMDHIVLLTGSETELGQFVLPTPRGQRSPTVNCISFAAESKSLLAGTDGGTLYALNCKHQEVAWHATKHRSAITALATSPDNDAFATASTDQVLLFSMEAERRAAAERRPGGESAIALPIGGLEEVSALAFSRPEGGDRTALRSVLLAGVAGNGTALVWRPADRGIVASFPHLHQGPATGVSFATEGSQVLYTCGMDRRLLTVDLRAPRQAAVKTMAPAPLTCLGLRLRSNNIAAGTSSGSMLIFDLRQMHTVLDELSTGSDAVLEVAWQPSKGSSSRGNSAAPTPKTQPAPAPPVVTSQLSPTASLGSPSVTPPPIGSDSPLKMDLSPAPAGVTPAPFRRPVTEGLLGESMQIASFAELAAEAGPPPAASAPSTAPPQRRLLTDGPNPIRPPPDSAAPAAAAPTTTTNSSSSSGRPQPGISRATSAAAPAPGSRLVSHNSAGASSASTAAAAAAAAAASGGGASRGARASSTGSGASSLQAQHAALNSPAKTRSGALSRYGSSASAAGQAPGSTKLYSAISQIPSIPGPGDAPSTSHADELQQRGAAAMVPYSQAPPGASGDGAVQQQQQQQQGAGGAGGKYITEQVFHNYLHAMEDRLQESMQSVHVDMIRSFHMLQSETQQLVAALASRQNDLEDRMMDTQALLERLLQRTQPSFAWQ